MGASALGLLLLAELALGWTAFGMTVWLRFLLRQGVQGISDFITMPGLINLDFADVRTIMKDAGSALMGIGRASGENRSVEAARQAIASPLLEVDIAGAQGILFNITGSSGGGIKLDPGRTYYINIRNIDFDTGQISCTTGPCNVPTAVNPPR